MAATPAIELSVINCQDQLDEERKRNVRQEASISSEGYIKAVDHVFVLHLQLVLWCSFSAAPFQSPRLLFVTCI